MHTRQAPGDVRSKRLVNHAPAVLEGMIFDCNQFLPAK